VLFLQYFCKRYKKAFEGVARRPTLYNEDKKAHRAWHYRSNNKYKPITSEINCSFRDKFARDKYVQIYYSRLRKIDRGQ